MAYANNPVVKSFLKVAIKVIGSVSLIVGVIALMLINFVLSGVYYSTFFQGLQGSIMGHPFIGGTLGWALSAGFTAIQLGFWGRIETMHHAGRDTDGKLMLQVIALATIISLVVDACATAGTITSSQGAGDQSMFLSQGPFHYWIMVIGCVCVAMASEPLVQMIINLPDGKISRA